MNMQSSLEAEPKVPSAGPTVGAGEKDKPPDIIVDTISGNVWVASAVQTAGDHVEMRRQVSHPVPAEQQIIGV
jgi:hypothetical protein